MMFPYAVLLLVGLVNTARNEVPGIVALQNQLKSTGTEATIEPSEDPTIKANVRFVFTEDHHSIVQTSLDAPCTPLENGFASPLESKENAMFSIAVEDHTVNQIWYACAKHCNEGEVGAILVTNVTESDYLAAEDKWDLLDPEYKWTRFLSNVPNAQNSFANVPQEGTPLGSGIDARVIDVLGFGTSTASASASASSGSSTSGVLSETGSTHLARAAIGGIAAAAVVVFLILVGLLVWRVRVLIKERRHAKTKHWAVKNLIIHVPPHTMIISGSDKPAMKEKGVLVTSV